MQAKPVPARLDKAASEVFALCESRRMDKEIDLAILLRDFIPKSFQLVVESKIDDKRVKTLSALDQLIDPVEEFVVLGTDPNRSTVQVRGLRDGPPDTVLVRDVQHQARLASEKHICDYTGLSRVGPGFA